MRQNRNKPMRRKKYIHQTTQEYIHDTTQEYIHHTTQEIPQINLAG